MKLSKLSVFILATSLFTLLSCADSKDFESVEIVAASSDASDDSSSDLFICKAASNSGSGYRLFKAVGRYSDDSTEELTDEVTWSSDASDDSILSSIIPGKVYCNTAWGNIGIKITYSLNTSDSSTTSTSDSNEFTDTANVEAK